MSNGDRVRAVLRDAGWSDIRLERFDIEHSIGIDVADAASFACQMGPMAEPFAQADDATKRNVMSTIRHALEPYAGPDGVRLGVSTSTEARRVGKECVSNVRTRVSRDL